jgi:hypothetical protein
MGLTHCWNRDVNILVAIGTALGNRVAEAFEFAEVAASARLLRATVVRDVMANGFRTRAPFRISTLLLVTLRAARGAGCVRVRGSLRRRRLRSTRVAVTIRATTH